MSDYTDVALYRIKTTELSISHFNHSTCAIDISTFLGSFNVDLFIYSRFEV